MSWCGHYRICVIARKLNRSEKAVRRRMDRLHLAPTTNGVWRSSDVARYTGFSDGYVRTLARSGMIPARKVPGGSWWVFDPMDFVE